MALNDILAERAILETEKSSKFAKEIHEKLIAAAKVQQQQKVPPPPPPKKPVDKKDNVDFPILLNGNDYDDDGDDADIFDTSHVRPVSPNPTAGNKSPINSGSNKHFNIFNKSGQSSNQKQVIKKMESAVVDMDNVYASPEDEVPEYAVTTKTMRDQLDRSSKIGYVNAMPPDMMANSASNGIFNKFHNSQKGTTASLVANLKKLRNERASFAQHGKHR